ncbi:MAG TPA: 3-dehydroquinate synthase [Ferruginibacter sp.]|nr:3-dehydroquinate synthase [Ferruginibacter sp.]
MRKESFTFSQKTVDSYFDFSFAGMGTICNTNNVIIITDENVFFHHREAFSNYRVITIKAGEQNKNQQAIDGIIDQLLQLEADKNTFIIGVGGGVVTDMAGYAASIYKRGVLLGLVPTSILGMVDAAIGGKNGVDVGMYKNMVGTIYQPEFIIYDYAFLQTLPVKEWINGFAEIIKHACIKDATMFTMLQRYTLHDFQTDLTLVADLIEKNAGLKFNIVTQDEFERGDRKLLNFGHTIGHAIENLHSLSHGHAISIGMVAACNLSEKINGFHFDDARKVVSLLAAYHLPVDIVTDYERVFDVLKLDKKRNGASIDFILLNRIGDAAVKPIELNMLHENFKSIL